MLVSSRPTTNQCNRALQHYADYCGFPRSDLDQFVELIQKTWPDANATE
jgi:hypothetical protein